MVLEIEMPGEVEVVKIEEVVSGSGSGGGGGGGGDGGGGGVFCGGTCSGVAAEGF